MPKWIRKSTKAEVKRLAERLDEIVSAQQLDLPRSQAALNNSAAVHNDLNALQAEDYAIIEAGEYLLLVYKGIKKRFRPTARQWEFFRQNPQIWDARELLEGFAAIEGAAGNFPDQVDSRSIEGPPPST